MEAAGISTNASLATPWPGGSDARRRDCLLRGYKRHFLIDGTRTPFGDRPRGPGSGADAWEHPRSRPLRARSDIIVGFEGRANELVVLAVLSRPVRPLPEDGAPSGIALAALQCRMADSESTD